MVWLQLFSYQCLWKPVGKYFRKGYSGEQCSTYKWRGLTNFNDHLLLGVAGIFLVFMFMYRYALKNTDELELNEMEIFETETSIFSNMLMAGIHQSSE